MGYLLILPCITEDVGNLPVWVICQILKCTTCETSSVFMRYHDVQYRDCLL